MSMTPQPQAHQADQPEAVSLPPRDADVAASQQEETDWLLQKQRLFMPTSLGALRAKNRILLGALTRGRCAGRVIADVNIEYYAQRRSAGLLVTEPASVSEEANGFCDTPGLYTDAQEAGWARLCAELHQAAGGGGEEPATLVCQLWHTGRMSHSTYQRDGKPPKAPSAIAIVGGNGTQGADGMDYDHETPEELTTAECEQIVRDFAQAAFRARRAGFDGVELHCATGYLLDTFLQSCSNARTDRYGLGGADVESGPELKNIRGEEDHEDHHDLAAFAGRFQFLREVLDAVCEVFPRRVGLKISPNAGFNGMGGADNFAFYTWLAEELNHFPIAYLHVMDGIDGRPTTAAAWWGKMTTTGFHNKGRPVTLADLRPRARTYALVGNANYTPASAAARIFEEKTADAVSFGRVWLANPDFVEMIQKHGKAHFDQLRPPPPPEAWFRPSEQTRAAPSWGYTDSIVVAGNKHRGGGDSGASVATATNEAATSEAASSLRHAGAGLAAGDHLAA